MLLGKVIGTIWATRKYTTLKSYKMQFVQPLNAKLESVGEPFIAVDTIGAGPGEVRVLRRPDPRPRDAMRRAGLLGGRPVVVSLCGA